MLSAGLQLQKLHRHRELARHPQRRAPQLVGQPAQNLLAEDEAGKVPGKSRRAEALLARAEETRRPFTIFTLSGIKDEASDVLGSAEGFAFGRITSLPPSPPLKRFHV